jgi:hypothetical protein
LITFRDRPLGSSTIRSKPLGNSRNNDILLTNTAYYKFWPPAYYRALGEAVTAQSSINGRNVFAKNFFFCDFGYLAEHSSAGLKKLMWWSIAIVVDLQKTANLAITIEI